MNVMADAMTKIRTPLRKTQLDKFLKFPVSEDPTTSNMVTGTKHCWNPLDSNFIIFIGQRERNWVGKKLS